jgi:hypothetical protein
MWMAIIYFISPADYGMNPVFMVVGTYISRHRQVLARLPRNEPDEMANPGLLNKGVICYANAIFQALAHFNHITSLFNNPPPVDQHDALRLNHAFCTVLHSLVRRPLIQGSEVDPSNFIELFTDIHRNFDGVESKFCQYSIRVFPPYH